jgi:hypothetical protein
MSILFLGRINKKEIIAYFGQLVTVVLQQVLKEEGVENIEL